MFKKRIIVLVICCTLALSACGQPTPTPDTQATVNAMYTSVVQTLAVSMPTVTPQPSLTPTLTATITPLVTNTLAATPTLKITESLCDNSLFLADVTIPDNTVMSPGQTFTKTWSIKNVGTCDWSTSYKVVFLSGTAMGGVSTAIPAITKTHADNISVTLVAPITKGSYTGTWILQNAAGKTFGTSFTVVINVGTSLTATTTGTITPTPDVLATGVSGALTATANSAAATTSAGNAIATAIAQTATAGYTPVP